LRVKDAVPEGVNGATVVEVKDGKVVKPEESERPAAVHVLRLAAEGPIEAILKLVLDIECGDRLATVEEFRIRREGARCPDLVLDLRVAFPSLSERTVADLVKDLAPFRR
jgi:hypothetical protein